MKRRIIAVLSLAVCAVALSCFVLRGRRPEPAAVPPPKPVVVPPAQAQPRTSGETAASTATGAVGLARIRELARTEQGKRAVVDYELARRKREEERLRAGAGKQAAGRRVTARELLDADPAMPAAQKDALVKSFVHGLVADCAGSSAALRAGIARAVGDSKRACRDEMAGVDVAGTPSDFAQAAERLVGAYAADEEAAAYALNDLRAIAAAGNPDPAMVDAMNGVLARFDDAIGRQKAQAAAALDAISQKYRQEAASRLAATRENLQAMQQNGVGAEIVDAYEKYAGAVETGDLDAISWTALEMSYQEFKESFLADGSAAGVERDAAMDSALKDLVANMRELDQLYGDRGGGTNGSPEAVKSAIDDLLYARFISDSKDYRAENRVVPDLDYTENLDGMKAYLDMCPADFKDAYSNHLAAWDDLNYGQVGPTWNVVKDLFGKYRLGGDYAAEWELNTNNIPAVDVSDAQRQAMEAIMQADHDLTEARNREIAALVGIARLDDLSKVSLSDCPTPVADAYAEFVGVSIYQHEGGASNVPAGDSSAGAAVDTGLPEGTMSYVSNKLDGVLYDYMSTGTTSAVAE